MKKTTNSVSLKDAPSTAVGRQEAATQVTTVSSECTAETRMTVAFQRTFVTKRAQETMLVRFAPDQAKANASTD